MNKNQNSTMTRVIVLVAILVVGAGALAYTFFVKKTNTSVTTAALPATTDVNAQTAAASSTTSTSTYKNGTYSATGSYISPGGDEKIGVTVTLQDDIITAASVKPEPVSSEGQHFQGIFQQNFRSLVVGKNIVDVHLSEVSGSSLTSGGFNQALAEIEAEAKV